MINEIVIFSAAAGIIFLGFAGEIFFKKTGISYYLFLIAVGIVLGPVFNVFPREPLIPVLGIFASFTLIMILFYSGMDMRIKEVIKGSPRTVVQVTIYVVSSIFLIGFSLHFILHWELIQSLIFGSIVGGETAAVVVIPLSRSLRLGQNTITFLTLESILNSIYSIVFYEAFVSLYKTGTSNWTLPVITIGTSFSIGIVVGISLSIVWMFVLKYVRNFKYTYVLSLGLLFFTYAITEVFHGSGLVAVLIFGLFLGSSKVILSRLRQKFDLVEMNDQFYKFQGEISFIMETFFFVFLGLVFVITPSTILSNLMLGLLVIGILLVFRFIATKASTIKSELRKDQLAIFLICAQGVVPATLSIAALNDGIPLANTFVSIAVYVIILSNIVTTAGSILVARKNRATVPDDKKPT
ncbi:Na+/H+ exchanger [Nitrosotalea devaniterrae]|uniref:Na+/H+ exchanger n=1 Tax=Nitrosotalea devaniterrae TaxID=1078905 RepID=A0A128A4G9_9ARCH|nr:Na+/H+ exchanger [Candidatus Nitrosotalea devanaterra]